MHKKARTVACEDDLNELKCKYNQLLLKTENFCKTVAYWKSCHNQTVELQVPSSQGPPTCNFIVDQLMSDMVILEDQFISVKQKCFTSHNNFCRHVAENMWHDQHAFLCHSVNSLLNCLLITFKRKCTHLQMSYVQWTWQVNSY